MAHLENRELRNERIIITNIKQSFQSVGLAFPNQILAIEDKDTTTESVN